MFLMEAEEMRVAAPMLFTTREKAEEELRTLREGMPDAYLRAIDEYGETAVNEALDNTPELGVFEIEPRLLGEHLEYSHVTYAVVDERLRLARNLAEELRGELYAPSIHKLPRKAFLAGNSWSTVTVT
jgi:hypothetical protein